MLCMAEPQQARPATRRALGCNNKKAPREAGLFYLWRARKDGFRPLAFTPAGRTSCVLRGWRRWSNHPFDGRRFEPTRSLQIKSPAQGGALDLARPEGWIQACGLHPCGAHFVRPARLRRWSNRPCDGRRFEPLLAELAVGPSRGFVRCSGCAVLRPRDPQGQPTLR